MSECAFARLSAILLACAVLLGLAPANAQDATQQSSPAQAAPPAPGETTLPEIVVKSPAETKPATKAKTKSAAKAKSSGGAVAAEGNAQSPPPSDPNAAKPETATGPVKGYVAKLSATGTKTDTPIREIPQSITVVGREEMRDQGAQTLQDTLRYVTGVVADGYGIDSRSDGSLVRGTEAEQFLDGLRRTFSYYTYTYRIDPYFMERVEVLRGPPSVLYGQAPVGGILNMVSKRPQEETAREITVEYGTYDFKQVKFDMTGAVTTDGKWLYRVTGLARDADTQVDYVEDDRLAISPAITYRPQAGTSITLLGHFRDDDTVSTQQFFPHVGTIFPNASGNRIARERFLGEPDEDKYDTRAASGTLLVEHKLDETFTFRHSTRYTDIHNDYDSYFAGSYTDGTETELTRYKWLAITDTGVLSSDTSLEAKVRTGALGHKILAGVDYADFRASTATGYALNEAPFNVYDPVYGLPEDFTVLNCDGSFLPAATIPMCNQPDQRVTQTGLYLQDQLRFGNWIGIVGGRYDWLENGTEGSPTQKKEAFTYRTGLMYEFAFGLTPYVSYAQSFIPEVGTNFAGETFDPREGEMVEAGFKYQPPGTSFMINGAVYDLTESNRLAEDGAHPGFSIQTGEISVNGFEIEARGDLTANIKTIANYSYTDAVYTGGDQDGYRVESVPEHLASFWLVYTFDEGLLKGFSAGGGVRYVGASWDGVDTVETPSYTLFDAMVAYDTKDWRWSLNASNLEDEYYLTTCLGFNRGDCFIGTGRTVTTGLTYKF